MKNKKTKINSPLIIIAVLILIVIVYFITRPSNFSPPFSNNYPTPTKIQNVNQVYASKTLKFTIIFPSQFKVEERFTTASINSIEGEILLSRVATDFENIEDYLNDLSVKNRIKITNRENIKINSLDGIRGKIDYAPTTNPTKYAYFVYADNWVYSLSTSSPALFDALDTIAQSFRYTP